MKISAGGSAELGPRLRHQGKELDRPARDAFILRGALQATAALYAV